MKARHRPLCANGAPGFYSLIIERRARARARTGRVFAYRIPDFEDATPVDHSIARPCCGGS